MALYGLPKGKGSGIRPRDLRRPRSGAAFSLALDVESDGTRWSVERDLSAGTVRILDRERGEDRTREFLRSGGRDVFGERMTGLTDALFRSTAYVGQNVLDRDELDSSLTLDLARIADAGGGEASVLRALKDLESARLRMPEALTGSTVSADTEVARAERLVAERRAEMDRRRRTLEGAREASARLARAKAVRNEARRRVVLAEASVDETDRLLLVAQLEETEAAERVRRALLDEAARLEEESASFTPGLLSRIDALREERGQRPEVLARALEAVEGERRAAAEEEAGRIRRLGEATALPAPERERLARALLAVIESEAEAVTAEEELLAQWAELTREGLADDIRRLDQLPPEEREFLLGAEEGRQSLEMAGVLCDRQRADARHVMTLVRAERKVRVAGGKRLAAVSAIAAAATVLIALAGRGFPLPWVAGGLAFAVSLAVAGAVIWQRGRHHREDDEQKAIADERRCQTESERIRKDLSGLRLRLDRVARRAGFVDATSLVRAHRRARLAEAKRRVLIERGARRDASLSRRKLLEREVDPFRTIIACSTGLPAAADARKGLALLEDVERAIQAGAVRRDSLAREAERLAAEQAALESLERELRARLADVGAPPGVPLPKAFLVVEAARKRAQRRREILEVELPARPVPLSREEAAVLRSRIEALGSAAQRRLLECGADRGELAAAATPEGARDASAAAREELRRAEEEEAAAERALSALARDGAEGAREAAEALAASEATLDRARLFRDALELAREALTAAAAEAYGDFRKGLQEASQRILASWNLPYESLEFADDLAVTVRSKDGRSVTRAELAAGLSTGAREQVHLTARLAALEYLGTGGRGVPLLLDDPLVGADDQRFRAVMRFLIETVLPERPVLVVSCHGWRHERLLSVLEPELRLRLEQVSIRSMRAPRGGSGGGVASAGPRR